MKKVIVMVAAAMLSGGVYADIYANMQVGFGFSGNGNAGGIVDDTPGGLIRVLLINGNGDGLDYNSAASGVNYVSLLGIDGNDTIISAWDSFVTATAGSDFSDYGALAANLVEQAYASDTYIRVIGGGVDGVTSGDWIWESGLITFQDINTAAVPKPAPEDIFYDNGGAGGVADGTVQVIPEPATIGLMGIAGLGMFLARRKARR